MTSKKNKVIKFGRFRYAAASAIAGVIVLLCFAQPMSNEQQVFDSNFVAYEDAISSDLDLMLNTRSAGGEDDAVTKSMRGLKQGMEAYNSQQYEVSAAAFEKYLAENPGANDFNQVDFYLAVSYISTNKTTEATQKLERLAAAKNPTIKEDAKWYLALVYARQGEKSAAKTLLADLQSSEKYGAKANKILNPTRRTTFK